MAVQCSFECLHNTRAVWYNKPYGSVFKFVFVCVCFVRMMKRPLLPTNRTWLTRRTQKSWNTSVFQHESRSHSAHKLSDLLEPAMYWQPAPIISPARRRHRRLSFLQTAKRERGLFFTTRNTFFRDRAGWTQTYLCELFTLLLVFTRMRAGNGHSLIVRLLFLCTSPCFCSAASVFGGLDVSQTVALFRFLSAAVPLFASQCNFLTDFY